MNRIKSTMAIASIAALACLPATFILQSGCSTATPQAAAYKTIAAIETGATAEINSYYALVIKGAIRTNDVPAVGAAFNHLQATVLAAVMDASGNTNAPAPVSLIAESALFTASVASASAKK